jgi:hypothetical protein
MCIVNRSCAIQCPSGSPRLHAKRTYFAGKPALGYQRARPVPWACFIRVRPERESPPDESYGTHF